MSPGEHVSQIPREELAYQLFRETNDAVVIVDPNSLEILDVNPAVQRMTGFREADLLGQDIRELLSSSTGEIFDSLLTTLNETGIYHSREGFELKCRNDVRKAVNISANRVHTASRQLGMVVMRDISARKRAEEKLRQTQELLTEAQRLVGLGSWSYEIPTRRFQYSDTVVDIFGLSQFVPATPESLTSQIVPEQRQFAEEAWEKLIKIGEPVEGSYQIQLSDGSIRHISTRARAIESDAGGNPVRVIGVTQDITERVLARQMEEEHRKSLIKLEQVFQEIEGFAWEYDLNTELFTYVSERAEKLLGYPLSAWLTTPKFFASIIHEEDRDEALEFCRQQTADDRDHSMDYRMIDQSGQERWIRDIVHLRHDASGKVTHLYGLMLDITERLRVREDLQRSEERYQKLFHDSPVSLWELDWSNIGQHIDWLKASGTTDLRAWYDNHPDVVVELAKRIRIVDVNRGTLDLYGARSKSDFINSFGSIFREDSLSEFKENLLSFAAGATSFEGQNVNYTLAGERIYVDVRTSVAPGFEFTLGRLYTSVSNVTARKHAELLRDGQRNVLEFLVQGASFEHVLEMLAREVEQQSPFLRCAVFVVNPVSGALSTVAFGSVTEELTTLLDGMPVESLFPPDIVVDSATHFDLRNAEVKGEGYHPQLSESVRNAATACGYPKTTVRRIVGADEVLVGVVAIVRTQDGDFTSHEADAIQSFRRIATLVMLHDEGQKALHQRTSQLNSLFSIYPDALLRLAEDGTVLERYSGNRLSSQLFDEDWHRKRIWNLVEPSIGAQFRTAIAKVSAGSELESVEFAIDDESQKRNFEVRFLPLQKDGGQVACVREVTRLKQTEHALRLASEQFQRLFDESPDAIFVESLEGVVLNANAAACELHQISRQELIGSNVMDLVPEADREAASVKFQEMAAGNVTEFDSSSMRRDGRIVPVALRISTIDYAEQPALLIHVRDITDRRRQEEIQREQERHLGHVSRLTMMGQLVAGIAHEIRQPLWSISTFADVCQKALARPDAADNLDKVRDITSKLVNESRRVNSITTRMFSFARKGHPERNRSNLYEVVAEAVALTRSRAKDNKVGLVCELPGESLEIICDRVLIEQTIVNLLNNAYTALRRHESDVREVRVSAGLDDQLAWVEVADTGPGLPEGIQPEQLFEGFFTTTHTGMGIGLALSRSFVEDHDGSIHADVNRSGGMTFRFTLRVDGGAEDE